MRAFQRCRRFIKRGYGVVAAVERRNRGSLLIRQFSLQNHSFAIVAMVNVERREGPKSCGERSGQTDRWNRDPSVGGRRPNLSLALWWIIFQFRAQNPRNSPLFISMAGSHFLGQKVRPRMQVSGQKVRPSPEKSRKLWPGRWGVFGAVLWLEVGFWCLVMVFPICT